MIKNYTKVIYNITHWESWHYLAKYIPLAPVWFYYAIKSGSLWWFTPSNPTLTFGGFEGEKKNEMYAQLPKELYPKTIYINSETGMDEVNEQVTKNGFIYPVAVKPDAGMMGLMFRKIEDSKQLKTYHEAMAVEYVLQELIDYPIEVSVFYYRYPGAAKGTITGFLKKEYMQVTGDGESTLDALITNYSRANLHREELRSKHRENLTVVVPKNKIVILSPALNLSRGGRLVSLENEIDNNLVGVFDKISKFSKQFYYGRYDIKCKSIEDIKAGLNFYILEFNGSGAEPHHIYGNGNSLFKAYKIVLQHWNILFKISRLNNKNGVPYWPLLKGWKFLLATKKHFIALKKLDTSFAY